MGEEVGEAAVGVQLELGLFGRLGKDGEGAVAVDEGHVRHEGGIAEGEEIQEGSFAIGVMPVIRRGLDPAGVAIDKAGEELFAGRINVVELGGGFGITYQLEEQVGVRTAAQPGGAVVVTEDVGESKALIQADGVIRCG